MFEELVALWAEREELEELLWVLALMGEEEREWWEVRTFTEVVVVVASVSRRVSNAIIFRIGIDRQNEEGSEF